MKALGCYGLLLALSAITAVAQETNQDQPSLHKETLEYQIGDLTMKGYLVYSEELTEPRPGILVVHEWWGLNDYPKSRAEQLARMGYVALAVDMYGEGANVSTQAEAKLLAGNLREDRELMRMRIQAALETLKNLEQVDPHRVAAIGYCFGGTVVLELARSGAKVAGVVSFHGNLDTPEPNASTNIQARILVLHGADDPMVPVQQLLAFQTEMREANADWQLNIYGDAVHSFTNPRSGTDKSKGIAYHEKAAKRAWEAMELFFHDLFGRPQAYVKAD